MGLCSLESHRERWYRADATVQLSEERVKKIIAHVLRLVELYKENEANSHAINLINIQLTLVPEQVLQLASLESLNMSHNRLMFLPSKIDMLKQLTELDISYNSLKSLPGEIGSLPNLKILDASDNFLTEIPVEIANLKRLQYLNVNTNKLTELPSALGSLSDLTVLHVSYNKLKSLPVSLARCTELTNFYCLNNELTDYPPELCQFEHLTDLYLSHNNIDAMPVEIMQMDKIKNLILTDNPILERTVIYDTDAHMPMTPLPLTHQLVNWAQRMYAYNTVPQFREHVEYLPHDLVDLVKDTPSIHCSECRGPVVFPLEYTCIKDIKGRRLALKNRLCGIECLGVLKRNLEFQRKNQELRI
eukprot:TRINITY_DN871_c0_g1_i2.p1 TRINITY_DN871_c0_g1~~TRINITY_DN871_c0_g1_i2.p1  ORF type:complete len:360 (-),score=48.28 TRINITY_DN871_c0_g1_i2:504-1583(-)